MKKQTVKNRPARKHGGSFKKKPGNPFDKKKFHFFVFFIFARYRFICSDCFFFPGVFPGIGLFVFRRLYGFPIGKIKKAKRRKQDTPPVGSSPLPNVIKTASYSPAGYTILPYSFVGNETRSKRTDTDCRTFSRFITSLATSLISGSFDLMTCLASSTEVRFSTHFVICLLTSSLILRLTLWSLPLSLFAKIRSRIASSGITAGFPSDDWAVSSVVRFASAPINKRKIYIQAMFDFFIFPTVPLRSSTFSSNIMVKDGTV